MSLKEKLELLNDQSSITEIQNYIEYMKKDRGFDTIPIEREFMLMTEEVGELAKAIRKETNGYLDPARTYDFHSCEASLVSPVGIEPTTNP